MLGNLIYLGGKYLRLSEEDGDKIESESIVNQSILIDNFLKNVSDITIIDTFKDDGYTGTDFERPGFQALMQAVEKGEINCIIVKDLSRLGREHIDVDRYVQKIFPSLGVRFISINDHYDSLTANDSETHLIMPVKSFVNDSYCRDISIKIRSNLAAKRQNGDYVGSYVAYGYKKDTADKRKLVIDPAAANVVTRIFAWKLEGMSNLSIANRLNGLGVLAPADYKKTQGINYKSAFQTHMKAQWSPVAIARILRNPIYIGTLIQGKTYRVNYKVKQQRQNSAEKWAVVPQNHEPIIDEGSYQLVQQLLNKDLRTVPGNERNYMFGGILFCGDCGRNMIHRSVSYKGKKTVYYICTTYNRGDGCSRHSIREDVLIRLVEDSVKVYSEMTDAVYDAVQLIRSQKVETDVVIEYDNTILRLREEKVKYTKLILTLSENLKKGIISKKDYETYRNKYQDQLENIEWSIEKQRSYISDLMEHRFFCDQWMEKFLEKPDIGSVDRDLVLRYIEKILVYENKQIEIVFRFQDEINAAVGIAENMADILKRKEG